MRLCVEYISMVDAAPGFDKRCHLESNRGGPSEAAGRVGKKDLLKVPDGLEAATHAP
jgi:hypothetical protein